MSAQTRTPVVDFVANFIAGGNGGFDPRRGRVVMSPERLVLVTNSARTDIPLTRIDDIALGKLPERVRDLFDDTVLVGYATDRGRRTVLIGGESGDIDRFSDLLYRATLRGLQVNVTYAARVGGLVTKARPTKTAVRLHPEHVEFVGEYDTYEIAKDDVSYVRWIQRTVEDSKRLVLSLEHLDADGESVITTEIAARSPRQLNVLARYLRSEFTTAATDASVVDVDEEEMWILLTLHTLGASADIDSIIEDEEGAELVDQLVEKRLLELHDDTLELTSQGRVLLNRNLESINM